MRYALPRAFSRTARRALRLASPWLLAAASLGLTPAHAAQQLAPADQGHIRLQTFLSIAQVEHMAADTTMTVKSLSCCGGAGNVFVGDRAYVFFPIADTLDASGGAVLHFDADLAGPAAALLSANEIFSPLAPFQVNYSGNDATGQGLFIDLGNGPVYATTPVASGAASFALALSGDALTRIDTVRGSFFGIGFTTDLSSVDNPMTLSNLVLEVSAVPEPAAPWSMLGGLLAIAGARATRASRLLRRDALG